MTEFFDYLKEMLTAFFQNLGQWFVDRWAYPWFRVGGEFSYYGDLFNQYSPSFGAGGWVMFIVFAILFTALVGALLFLLFWLIRKYVKFYRTQVEKDRLRDEVEKLNIELYNAIQEKNRVLALQVGQLGLRKPEDVMNAAVGSGAEEKTDEDPSFANVRFPRLCQIDRRYANLDTKVVMKPEDMLSLEDIAKRFRMFAASQLGLYYTIDTMRVLFAAIGTGHLIILEGISGTGKTSLPYALGRFFKHPADICSVQPSWRDRSELLGYYNDFTKKFTETDFLRAVYEATYRQDPTLIVLDEMNLARIEYYFAEFLSIMEMPNTAEWKINLIASSRGDDPKHLEDGKLLIPQNIWFVGTANNDDSTFTITDKVYDRAMSLFFSNKGIAFEKEFTEPLPMPASYLEKLFADAKAANPISPVTLKKFDELDTFVIKNFHLAFGNRILKQMHAFVPIYVACGGTEYDAIDYVFSNKVLKKFETFNLSFLRNELVELDRMITKLFGKNEFPISRDKIKFFLKMNA
jgi:cell division protein FtsL